MTLTNEQFIENREKLLDALEEWIRCIVIDQNSNFIEDRINVRDARKNLIKLFDELGEK